MKALVTGGAGFIGSHICQRLLKEGHQVICLDNFDLYYDPRLKRQNIQPLLDDKGFHLVEGDVGDLSLLQMIIGEGIDYVFHNAAQPGVRASVEDPLKPHQVNSTGMLNLLQACVNSGVKKLINASSSSVYGKVSYLPFDEAHPKTPLSPYGVSKLIAEEYCRVFAEIYGLRVTSLRLFTVYGPQMRPDLAISVFTRKALKDETIEIFGDGSKTRDFTYIDDVVESNLLAMAKGDGEVYNIGGGDRLSINELAQKIIEITASRSQIVRTEAQKGDAEHTWANTEKARRDLGWQPKVGIAGGLERFVEWARSVTR